MSAQPSWKNDFPVRQSEEQRVARRQFLRFACCSAAVFGAAGLTNGKLLTPRVATEAKFVARIGEIPARELDARANRKRLGHGLLVVSTPPDAYELVSVALRVVDGTAVKVRIADHRERPAAHCARR